MTRDETDRALFDRIARRYARKDVVGSSSLARESQLLDAVQPVLDEMPHLGTIVDVGCGVGAAARYLAGCYERYVGVDQSTGMIEAAVAFNRGNSRAEFVAEDVTASSLSRDLADVILSDGALHHVSDLDETMVSLVRIAKPGAFLVVREPQNGNPLLQVMRWVRGIVDSSYSREQVFFSEEDLRHLLENHGIRDVLVRFRGFLAPPFAQVVMSPQALTVPLSRAAIRTDRWLDAHLPDRMKGLSFNIVLVGRFAP